MRFEVGTSRSVACPGCGERIEPGSLRCKHCGADARGAERQGGVAYEVRLDAIASPLSPSGRALEILGEIERSSPELYAWLGSKRGPDGERVSPQPIVDARVVLLLEEGRKLLGI